MGGFGGVRLDTEMTQTLAAVLSAKVRCRSLFSWKDVVMTKKMNPELKAKAVRFVREHEQEYASSTAARWRS